MNLLNTGAGEALLILLGLAIIVIHGLWKGELYWDTVTWQVKKEKSLQKSDIEKFNHIYYITERWD